MNCNDSNDSNEETKNRKEMNRTMCFSSEEKAFRVDSYKCVAISNSLRSLVMSCTAEGSPQ